MEFRRSSRKVPAWRPWWQACARTSRLAACGAWIPVIDKADNHGSVRIDRLRKTDNGVFDAAIRPAVFYVALPGREPLATDYRLWIACDLSLCKDA